METRSPTNRAQPSFHRRAGRLPGLLLVLLTGVAGVILAAVLFGRFGDEDVGLVPVPTAVTGLSQQERSYYDYVAPRLHELGAQARELARLGEARSRNIFDLQAHAGRLSELASEIDAYVAANGVPEAFRSSHTSYLEGIRIANRAIDEAERALLSADWERLGRAVAVFVDGAEDLEEAAGMLDLAGGSATPDAALVVASPTLERWVSRSPGIFRAV